MTPRQSEHKGRAICISGACNACLVWVDDKPVLGVERRFESIKRARARAAAVDYINRHAA